jgi:glycosyltransferase involved in cell wall biosynthesis
MKIAIVSGFFSEGMGYTENCLPKAMAALGHEVHLITSNLNIYGNSDIYADTYESFLGPADQGIGKFQIDGYTVHRLPSKLVFGYVYIRNLYRKMNELSPDIVHSTEIASLQTYVLATIKPKFKYRLFTESHQHVSIIKHFLKYPKGNSLKIIKYRLTRTFPSYMASMLVEKCYAISPDCAFVANVHYGVPNRKIILQPLGTDTDLFRSAVSDMEIKQRSEKRKKLGYTDEDIVCIYTGRFSEDKNPLLLARAVSRLASSGVPFHGLFIGDGIQKKEIMNCPNVTVLPFMKHKELADYYRAVDLAVWPTQESMSMLDAAASGLPLIVSDKIGEYDRIEGNGKVYKEGDDTDLSAVLASFSNRDDRYLCGQAGRKKMINGYSWNNVASKMEKDYISCLGK